MSRLRLLSGPDLAAGSEALNPHTQRLGPLPAVGPDLFDSMERSGLTGRGGAAFPVARKWRAVSAAGGGGALIVNGAEGEPQSFKDRTLMSLRPHLVLDGALLAARAVRASSVVLYIGEEHRTAQVTMARAVDERPEHELRHARVGDFRGSVRNHEIRDIALGEPLGLDHQRLTYRYAGRDFRLTDVYGTVVNEIIA